MIRSKRLLASVVLATGLVASALAPALAAELTNPDDSAKLLAGMQPAATSPLAAYTKDSSWQRHARYFDSAWKTLDATRLSKIKAWSAQNVASTRPVLVYTFSGPDFLYADAFFPNATTYVLGALEPVGQVPDLTTLRAGTLSGEIGQLEGSLNSVLAYSFFITKKMKTQLGGGQVTGTLPLLYVFLARSGKTITSASTVTLAADGTVTPADGSALPKGGNNGVKIEFSDEQGRKKTLYYFSTDLSNDGIKAMGFTKFAASLGPGDAFTKSASYLMHNSNFAEVRDFMLANSGTIVQDDSGIPVRFFGPEWQFHPFGRYVTPLSIFPGTTQPKLAEIFRRSGKPMDFGIGYRWRPSESNLLLAIKGDAPVASADPATTQSVPETETKPKTVYSKPARKVRKPKDGSFWDSF
jgi:hypothetical protein